jgi:hypothetical protein
MTINYEKREASILAWRSANRNKYNEMQRRLQKVYYQTNKLLKNKRDLGRYYFQQEAKRLRDIDLQL